MAQRAYQAVSKVSDATLTWPGKSATLAYALDAKLTTKPAKMNRR
jgi:hypothetical protein